MSRSQEVMQVTQSLKHRRPDPLRQIREYARHLHQALLKRWLCKCQNPHIAKLLERWSANSSELPPNFHFRVLFSVEPELVLAEAGGCTWYWQEAEIRIHPKR